MNPFTTYTEAELKKARKHLKHSLWSTNSWNTGWAFMLRELWQRNLAIVEGLMEAKGIEILM